jgi:hypothetical protein
MKWPNEYIPQAPPVTREQVMPIKGRELFLNPI